jgi:hypothetical protein
MVEHRVKKGERIVTIKTFRGDQKVVVDARGFFVRKVGRLI